MGVPEITGKDLILMAVIIGIVGWGSIELVIFIFKWLSHHLQWV
jgi:hypothetical protein